MRNGRPFKGLKLFRGGITGLVILLLIAPSSAGAPTKKKAEKVIFSFATNLEKAETVRVKGEESHRGEWTGDRFRFATVDGPADIVSGQRAVTQAGEQTIVWFPVGPGYDSSLIYSGTPVASKLRVSFGVMADWEAIEGTIPPVLFEVWIGRKLILEAQITGPGWREKVISLTLPHLLQRKYRFTFKARTLGSEWRYLVFYGRLE